MVEMNTQQGMRIRVDSEADAVTLVGWLAQSDYPASRRLEICTRSPEGGYHLIENLPQGGPLRLYSANHAHDECTFELRQFGAAVTTIDTMVVGPT